MWGQGSVNIASQFCKVAMKSGIYFSIGRIYFVHVIIRIGLESIHMAIPLIRHITFSYLRVYMKIVSMGTGDITIYLI